MSFVYFVAFACINVVIGDQIVTTRQGQLNGTVLRSRDGKTFYAFYGIPYAEAPVGKLRFSEPTNPPSWTGIRDGSKKPPFCLQTSFGNPTNVTFYGQEDCLYLNVFTPQIKSNKPLPVLVYIHGGAFRSGRGDKWGPHFYMDKPLVVVTMNYRLGVLGLLSNGNSVIPGNYALKDQVAALKWVQSNIANFGGDPKSVTLQGQSSGAANVHLHTMSPKSRGLFHRVIIQSGNTLPYWAHNEEGDAKQAFTEFVRRVNCHYNTDAEMLSCLRNLSAKDLVATEQSILTEEKIAVKIKPEITLGSSLYNLTYWNTSIPWIIGFNSAEAIGQTIQFLKQFGYNKEKLTQQLRRTLSFHPRYRGNEAKLANATATVTQFYFNNATIGKNDAQQICNLYSDVIFNIETLHAAYIYPGPKYFYYYDYKFEKSAELSIFNLINEFDIKGAAHSDELQSLFFNEFSENLKDAEVAHSRKMVTYWTNFVINGTPNSQNDQLPRWDLFQPQTGDYLYIANDQITMRKQILSERYAFWKALLLDPPSSR